MSSINGRFALVVSPDTFNQGSSSVLVMPTTRGDIDPHYVDYYPPLEQMDTRVSCRNISTIHENRLNGLQIEATRQQLVLIARRVLWPYLDDGLWIEDGEQSELSPGNVHHGFIPLNPTGHCPSSVPDGPDQRLSEPEG